MRSLKDMEFCGLVLPNPREHYKNTRSYEDIRFEYDLLNGDKITEQDFPKFSISTSVHVYLFVLSLTISLISILFLTFK